MPKKQTRYIFVTGGVMSSLGKGLTAASLGAVLQARGLSVVHQKLDPYLNVDPGTMSPFQHGEVYVTEDGTETDLDLGHYERFTEVQTHQHSNYTAGQVYQKILAKERRGDYLGATVQVVPHVTSEMMDCIAKNEGQADFALVEIGGTAGEIESAAFYESIRQFAMRIGREHCLYMHLTYAPYLKTAGEVKTKPTQNAVKELLKLGIQADIIVVRSDDPLPQKELSKIALFANLPESHVVSCPDSDSIYRVPVTLHENGLDNAVLDHFHLKAKKPHLKEWTIMSDLYIKPSNKVRISIVGKYIQLGDSYKSLNEALVHGGFANKLGIDIDFVDAEILENYTDKEITERFADTGGILVPGGFGARGTEGKIKAIKYARENDVPYFGICLGMQLAVIEFARHVAGLKGAGSTEFTEELAAPKHPVIALMTEWQTECGGTQARTSQTDLGGTMRLGAYGCKLQKGTKAYAAYGKKNIQERHRHRYEFNNTYWNQLEEAGLIFSGVSADNKEATKLAEMIELKDHPWFVAGQFHPEFKSYPRTPHPLFAQFIKAALEHQNKKGIRAVA